MQMGPAVAVIGAGASGVLTAIHLLKLGGLQPRIYLIEKHDIFGSGAAYSTSDPAHLLNTRAGNMSAFVDQPAHFLEWLKSNDPSSCFASPHCFVSRKHFGSYLRALLREVSTTAEAAGRFYLVPDEATALEATEDNRFKLALAMGKHIIIDAVILATGNPAPHPPAVEDNGVLSSRMYIGDPWSGEALNTINSKEPVLLLGTGLTMVDVALSLMQRGHKGIIHALSRRGLLPRQHGEPSIPPLPHTPALVSRLARDLRSVRHKIKEEASKGRDWRDVIDALRPVTSAYWRSLPKAEKLRFLRHLRPWWDVHRHRLAPQVASVLQACLTSGQLIIHKGRLSSLALDSDGVQVTWFASNPLLQNHLVVSSIVNCMGPGNNPDRSALPIMQHLLKNGFIIPDDLGLGIAVDSACRVITSERTAHPCIFALGPTTRGTFWEVTAVPDIRVQAGEVAKNVLLALQKSKRAIV